MSKIPILGSLDLSQNQLLNPVYQNLATDPATGLTGQFFYNSTNNKPKYHNGTAWVEYDAGKEGTITAGTTSQYFRGDKSWQTLNTTAVAEGTNLYFTNARVNTAMAAYTGDITFSGTGATLKTVNSNVGTFGAGATATIPAITVNAKGLVTAVSTAVLPTKNIFGRPFNYTSDVAGVATVSGLTITANGKTVNLTVDTNGNLIVDNNLISTGELSAYGAGSLSGGTGGGLITNVYDVSGLTGTYNATDYSNTFNAYAIKSIFDRVVAVEGGSATSISTTGAGNAVTSISKSGTVINVNKDTTFLTGNQNITVTGDITGSGATNISLILKSVNGNVGSFGSSTAIPTFTVNAKGLITAAGTAAVIAPAGTLSGTALAAGVVGSSLTSVGTLTSGTWNAGVIAGQYGGTGVNNAGKTITLGGNLTTAGAYATTLTVGAATNVTLPSSGTLYGTATSSITSAQLGTSLSDCTGNGGGTSKVVFNTSPTILTSIVAGSASMDLLNTVATTVNAFGAATTLNIGAATGTSTIKNDLVVSGNLTVNGTTVTVNSTTLSVDDKNIELGSVASPSNTTADGGGITLKGATDKTFNWLNSTSAWTSSESLDLVSGKTFKIAGNDILGISSNVITIGSTGTGFQFNNTNSTITKGVWAGSVVSTTYGGTGFNDAKGGICRKVAGTITGGTTSFTVVHGLSGDVTAQVYEVTSGIWVLCEIINQTAGTTVFNFNVAPVSGFYKYIITG